MTTNERPSMRIDDITGSDAKKLFHLANRAAKRLREAGRESDADDMRGRIINENVRFTFAEALEIVREYVEIEGDAPIRD